MADPVALAPTACPFRTYEGDRRGRYSPRATDNATMAAMPMRTPLMACPPCYRRSVPMSGQPASWLTGPLSHRD